MCRLFCWAAYEEVSPDEVLGTDSKLLSELSLIHKDGWGGATCNRGVIQAVHAIDTAAESDSYSEFISETKSAAGMVHLRWATETYAVCLENTHPFVADGIAFEHNGGFQNVDSIIELIDPAILAQRQGAVDSEVYFLYLQTLLKTKDICAAYEELIPVMEKQTKYTSLNAMILTPTKLHVIAAHNDERRPKDVEADYYHLAFQLENGVFSAWSSGVREISGQSLPNNHILTVDLTDLSLDLSPLNLKG
jgi:predicted glutamine amidotransferase